MAMQLAHGSKSMTTCVVKPMNVTGKKQDSAAISLKELKVQVQITEQDSKKTACCKSDGMRFAGADTTVKLRQDMSYIISITITPAAAVSANEAEVKHRQAECQEPSMLCCCLPQSTEYESMTVMEWSEPVKLPLTERCAASNNTKAVYEVSWDCNMELTGRGVRGEVALDIAVQDFGCLTVPILAKVYKHADTSAAHGKQSKLVQLECFVERVVQLLLCYSSGL
eukprot:GHRR01018889.1.p2 GENE.GHRR01018889.1~~GHRR01018889.1.p2  ORF type:complete len:225 (+),score=73.66 GHRR01018889.1:1889-2563(+)